MKNNKASLSKGILAPLLSTLLSILLSMSCTAADGSCSFSGCSGDVIYVKIRASGSHAFSLDMDTGEYADLLCVPENTRYLTVADTAAKKEILSALLSSYTGKRRVSVTVNSDSGPCEVQTIMLQPKGN